MKSRRPHIDLSDALIHVRQLNMGAERHRQEWGRAYVDLSIAHASRVS